MVAAGRMQRRLSALIILVTSAECFSSPLSWIGFMHMIYLSIHSAWC